MWTAVGWKNRDMAKTAGAPKKVAVVTRLPIKDKTMRELMFASGGRCAMTDCGLPLIWLFTDECGVSTARRDAR